MAVEPALHSADAAAGDWWRDAVIYQVYVRSFCDGDGDGVGDLAGVRAKLGYLRELGVDALWFNPWYPSPLADGGYDVADYRAVAPELGTLEEAELLVAEALALGIRTILDVVPNHVSDQHPWFRAALAAAPGSPERARFWFRPGLGDAGDTMPTEWVSEFGGTTWTRTTDADGRPGEWYLHLFSPQQPDLDWRNPTVVEEHLQVLRFWFDRGVAGIRIDSAALLVKDERLPAVPATPGPGGHPFVDRDEIHEIYRGWRAVADAYEPPRVLVGEVWLEDPQRFARYLRPDELHTAFNFDFMTRPWDAKELRDSIEATLASHRQVGAPPTWVLANHDVTRTVTRYGREVTSFSFGSKRFGTPTDFALGTRRARAAALLVAALPGALYVYQGEELGLPEVEDLPRELLRDPMHARSGGVDPGRDGCRVPLPWSGEEPPFGFTTGSSPTELPQPRSWAALTVECQERYDDSMLALYRAALRLRRGLRGAGLGWVDLGDGVIAFTRDDLLSVTNFSTESLHLPAGDVLLRSDSSHPTAESLPPDATAWLRPTR
ncbi:alpha-glucosidase [Motilibacter rhizosphaerae]|uniref:Alpha-glucosidase n=1 Tax=Motilibacter rhizosphaerae TaxID=598652 RepID=A0A4Q7NVW7_9ACTN|nr:alpha-amylase family glycosyl hydrolase [Motilibacter rhizosphaerae]RZS91335.1 alpha-glucosidase [Motilibacter rhizosphaerae]